MRMGRASAMNSSAPPALRAGAAGLRAILRSARRKKNRAALCAGGTVAHRLLLLELVDEAQVVIQARLHRNHRAAECLDGLVLRLVQVVAFEPDTEALEPAGL